MAARGGGVRRKAPGKAQRNFRSCEVNVNWGVIVLNNLIEQETRNSTFLSERLCCYVGHPLTLLIILSKEKN